MKQQRVRTNPQTGKIEHYYEDQGPSAAVAGHGRPVMVFASRPWTSAGHSWPAGTMQLRLSSPGQ